jgi:hypothetical protein
LKSLRIPRSIGELLPEAMPLLADRLAEVELRRSWEATVGADVARRARPGVLAEGCLTVVVDNSPWLHELSLRRGDLLTGIRRRCPSVKTLRLTVGPLPGEADATAPTGSRPSSPLSRQDRHEIEEATATISDPALAQAARRLLARARQSRGTEAPAP